MRLLSIDPSIDNVGVALILDGSLEDTYTFRTDAKKTNEERLQDIARHFSEHGKGFDTAVIEYPDWYKTWGGGGIKNMKSLTLLHIAIGAIVGGLSTNDIRVEFCLVSEWKGNTKKETTQRIVELEYGKRYNTHQSDAILMGMRWLQKARFRNAIRRVKMKITKT